MITEFMVNRFSSFDSVFSRKDFFNAHSKENLLIFLVPKRKKPFFDETMVWK